MPLPRKRPSWTILCCLANNPEDEGNIGVCRLKFKTPDLDILLLPEGRVTQFSVQAMLGVDFGKVTPGIYTTPFACCAVFPEKDGLTLQGYAEKWEPLKELIFKILSNAGCRARFALQPDMTQSTLIAAWSEAMLRITRAH